MEMCVYIYIYIHTHIYTYIYSGSSKQAWHIPDSVCTVLELLMMGGETARNV